LGGAPRKVLMQAPKNGFFYVLDRATGELLSAEPFVPVTWATHVDLETGRPVEASGARYLEAPLHVSPGPFGGHNWHPMSCNPVTGLVYIPAQENWFAYGQPAAFERRAEAWNTGVRFGGAGPAPAAPRGHLLAWDPVAQQERWRVPYQDIWNGGTLSTAGDLVFQGTSDGRLVAYHAETGEALREITLGGGVIAPPITYDVDGVQYLAIMAGWGGSYGVSGGRARAQIPGRVLAFRLGGAQALPTQAAPADRPAPEPIAFEATPEQLLAGAALYTQWCSVCHGAEAVSGGVLPDLRYAEAATIAALADIVLRGARSERGMPSFGEWLEAEDVDRIRAYLLSRRALLR
jgi:quinohemoprotein ethanol dehydrogenase